MSKIDDGGPAFPRAKALWAGATKSWDIESSGGMSMRDWFAGQALVGIAMGLDGENVWNLSRRIIEGRFLARAAYAVADAMLAARAEDSHD